MYDGKPTLHKPTWMVYTTDVIYRGFVEAGRSQWVWTAQGPRGSESGVEATSGEATTKAYAAFMLLSNPEKQATNPRAAT